MLMKWILALLFASLLGLPQTLLASPDNQVFLLYDNATDDEHSGTEKTTLLVSFLLGVRGHLTVSPIGKLGNSEFMARSSDREEMIKYILGQSMTSAGGNTNISESLHRLEGESDLNDAGKIIIYSSLMAGGLDQSAAAHDICDTLEIFDTWMDSIQESEGSPRKLMVFLRTWKQAPWGYDSDELSNFDCRREIQRLSPRDLAGKGLARLRSIRPDKFFLFGDVGLETILCGELNVSDEENLCRQPDKSKFNMVVEIDRRVLNTSDLRKIVETGISKNVYGFGPTRRLSNVIVRKVGGKQLPADNDIWIKVRRGDKGAPFKLPYMEVSIPDCNDVEGQRIKNIKAPLQPSRKDAAFWVAEQINNILPEKLSMCWKHKSHNLLLTLSGPDGQPILGEHELKIKYGFVSDELSQELLAAVTGNPGEYLLDEFPRGVQQAEFWIIPHWGASSDLTKEFVVASVDGSRLEESNLTVQLSADSFSTTVFTLRTPSEDDDSDIALQIFMRSLSSNRRFITETSIQRKQQLTMQLLPGQYTGYAIPEDQSLLSRESAFIVREPESTSVNIVLLPDQIAKSDQSCEYIMGDNFTNNGELTEAGKTALKNSALILQALLNCTSKELMSNRDLSSVAQVWNAINSHLLSQNQQNCVTLLSRGMNERLELRTASGNLHREACKFVAILFQVITKGSKSLQAVFENEPDLIDNYNYWLELLAEETANLSVLDEEVAQVLSLTSSP